MRRELIRHDRSGYLATGMFVMPDSGIGKLDAWHQIGDVLVRYAGPDPLRPNDLRVLHAISLIAARESRAAAGRAPIDSARGQLFASMLRLEEDGAVPSRVRTMPLELTGFRTSLRELSDACGMGVNGPAVRQVWDSISRLASVTVHTYYLPSSPDERDVRRINLEIHGERHVVPVLGVEISALIASARMAGSQGGLDVVLNARETAALLGRSNNYTVLVPEEVFGMRTDAGQLLLSRLCATIDPGRAGRFSDVTLEQYLYVNALERLPANRLQIKERQRVIRRGMRDLEQKGWLIQRISTATGLGYAVQRPALPAAERLVMPPANAAKGARKGQ